MTQYSFVPGGGKSASVNGLPSGPMTYLILGRNGSNIHTLAHARPRPGGRPDDSTLRCTFAHRLRPAGPTDPGVCGGGLGTRRVSDWQLPLARLIPIAMRGRGRSNSYRLRRRAISPSMLFIMVTWGP